MNIAVILAGGTGKRMGCDIPKQFLMLGNKPVIAHSIETFHRIETIDEIAVVVHPDWRSRMEEIVKEGCWSKVRRVVDGGEERYLSTLNALSSYLDCPDDTNLIFHDAARPWVSEEIIERVLASLREHEAVGVGIASTDTVWEVRRELTGERFIARIPERKLMWRAQTPQAFRLGVLRDAYQRALQDPSFAVTDDCGVVKKYMPEMKIHIVEGDEANRKITYAADLSK